jgi:SAM-dependent methyltransferase
MTAAERWARDLAAWAIPDEILAAAPESPWGHPPRFFGAPAEASDTPSRVAARDALGDGGTVLDVGCGGGAAGFALVPPATMIVGVDESAAMLEVFAAEGDRRGIKHDEVLGRWPDVAGNVPSADVVVCHHVAYNVPDLAACFAALTEHAHRRVVVELTDAHPMTALAPLWKQFWDLDRPSGPTAADAAAVARELGYDVQQARATRSHRWSGHVDPPERAEFVAWMRRRLCLTADRDPEVDAALAADAGRPSDVVTLCWSVGH